MIEFLIGLCRVAEVGGYALGLHELPLKFEPTDLPIAERTERMRQIATDLAGAHGIMSDAVDALRLALRGYARRRTDRFTLRGTTLETRLPNAPARAVR